ncbi:hypothetical protein NQ315_007168 [Exocentrus adspersus]|uniref:Amidohydrolase-related domain-containing protein n=1 Tax=Exocentrus adspersus TaxID=1586481 RepID=A0AAV8WDF8_9CUCU|nr:hypothetical protein NQ315_007168 [Exocentrus adspersus]
MSCEKLLIVFGNIVHCTEQFKIHVIENGFVMVSANKILEVNKESALLEAKVRLNITKGCNIEEIRLKKSQILIPGLIDTHIHAPQYPNSGLGYDKPLLDWLDSYTYKLEKKYKDLEFSKKVYNAVVRKTLNHGTTTACYFGSLFADSSMELVDSVIKHGQRALIGKINMITLAPSDYLETRSESVARTESFIKAVLAKQNDLVQPVITPRFALSVDMDLMTELGRIAKQYDLHIQASRLNFSSHTSRKTILAHGIYLTDSELKLLAERGTSVSHCPESNTCLKSGLCDVRRLIEAGIKVGLGTDVSGGPSASVVQAMKAALDVSVHISFQKPSYVPLNFEAVFYLATLGGAEALAYEDKIGNFETGKDFDALIVDMDLENCSSDYLLDCSPSEILQKFIYLGDDRNIVNVFVAGRRVK